MFKFISLIAGVIIGFGISFLLYKIVVKDVFNKLEKNKRGAKNG